jgi:hypothetical protein
MKLKLFRKRSENINLCHFSSCDFLLNNGSVTVPLPSVRAIEMIDSLAENFIIRFNDFRNHAKNMRVFETHFPLKSVILQKNRKFN